MAMFPFDSDLSKGSSQRTQIMRTNLNRTPPFSRAEIITVQERQWSRELIATTTGRCDFCETEKDRLEKVFRSVDCRVC